MVSRPWRLCATLSVIAALAVAAGCEGGEISGISPIKHPTATPTGGSDLGGGVGTGATPSPTPSPTPTASPTSSPSPTPTPSLTPSPAPSPTPSPSPSPSPTPTATPTPSPTPVPTAQRVVVSPTSATLNAKSPTGQDASGYVTSIRLDATVTMTDGSSNTFVTWSSSDPSRATVGSDGTVQAPATATAGTVTIKATAVGSSQFATALITVTTFGRINVIVR